MDESELIAGCRRGDRGAQREVYRQHADRVYRIALRLTRNEQDAFDVAQETFLRAFEQIGRFSERSRLATWLYRIATNEALQMFRRRETERRHLRLISVQQPAATRPDTEAAQEDLDDALSKLSDEYRAILVLRYQEGLSYEELAGILRIAPGTVASRLNRARAELRNLLGPEPPGLEEHATRRHPTKGEQNARQGPATAGGS